MKTSFLIGWIFCLATGCAESESRAVQHLPIHEKLSPNSLKQDYEQFVRVLRKNHPALYDFVDKSEYDRAIEAGYELIKDSLTIAQFSEVISPLLARVGCGHSNVRLPDWVWKDSAATVLPVKLFFQNKRVFVSQGFESDTHFLRAGAEILSINAQPVPSLLASIESSISTDGNNASNKMEVLNRSFPHLLAIHTGFPKEYELLFRAPDSDSARMIRVSPITAQRYFSSQPKTGSNLRLAIDTAKSTATITIESFGYYDKVDEFKAFIDQAFDKIKSAKIANVILDLRDNGGGDPWCAAHLMSYLIKNPVAYFSEPYGNYEALAKPLPVFSNTFQGQLFILTNGNCFSTTGHLCALLRYHRIGTFIGSETAGTYTCNDNSQSFHLNHSGLIVKVARSTFAVAVRGIPRFTGIIPDYPVEQSLPDKLAGRDAAMEFAAAQIENASDK